MRGKNNPPTSPLRAMAFNKGGQRGILKGGLEGINGLTLVEVLIAMVLLLLVSLALMQTALMSIDSNARNLLRDEAVSIAETEMNEARNIQFDAIASVPATTIRRKIRGLKDPADAAQDFPYTVTRTVNNLTTDNRQINITVTWSWKREPFSHGTTTIVRRQ